MRAANSALAAARHLAGNTEPPVLDASDLDAVQASIETMPPAAVQVLKHGLSSPFSALGAERLADKRQLLKKYRKLALELHPDRCEHALANDAMQVLNSAFEAAQGKGRGRAR